MGNQQDTIISIEAFKVPESLDTDEKKLKAINALKEDLLVIKPAKLLETIMEKGYQEAVSYRIIEYVENENLIISTLELLKALCIF